MAIRYLPRELLKKIAPERKIKKLLAGDLTVNKAALSFVSDIEFLNKKDISSVALKVAKSYRERVSNETATDSDLKDDPSLLVQRVQNEVVSQVAEGIKGKYSGEFYVWLPSSADEPDPEHQLNYGQTFQIGVGEMPGDRYGCQCGMEILVDETQLNLGE